MGKGLVDLHSPQGFAAETTSAAAILASAHMGFGLSTTQVCSGSVIGSGVGRKLSLVRWGTARKMMYGWLLTLPAAALFGAAAAAVALTGPFGVVLVLVALVVGTTTIVAISRRTAVNRHNVSDSCEVTVRLGRGSLTPAVIVGARVGSVSGDSHSEHPDDIGPITITHPLTPGASTRPTSPGSSS
jgi:PiT family inorganic phosphate transporter